MVVGAIVIGAIIIGGLIAAALLISSKAGGSDMSPQGLDSFQITSAEEGKVVPWVFGKVRLNTNFLWYGNLETIEVTEEVEGGKGGGGDSEEQVVGYDYFMDMWQAICEGPGVTLEAVYIQDKPESLSVLGSYSFNDGNDPYFPTEPGQWASPLTGVAHIFFDRYYLGLNASMVPTFHFIVNRPSTAPLTNANLSNGVNPAAIIYEIFEKAGAVFGDFDITALTASANYWASKGYGMNITFSKQEKVRDMINRVFTYVDGAVTFSEENKIVVRAYKDTDASVVTIDEDKFKDFQFTRRSWDDVYSDFRANYIDSAQDFTERTLRVRNPAIHALIGYERQRSIDMTAFRDQDTASKRLWEIMKKLSYPEAQVMCKLGIEYSNRDVGDIFTINNADYGITGMEFRVWEKDMSEIDSNEVSFRLMQYLENLFDSNYEGGGNPEWTTPTYDPVAVAYQDYFELPFTSTFQQTPAYLILAARVGQEDGFILQYSPNGSNYVNAPTVFTSFSQRGTLDQTYPVTFAIDDEEGILFTPYRDDPQFATIDRDELFTSSRFALLNGTELVGFQTITPVGVGSFRLGGVIRGILNTPVVSHASGQDIWVGSFANNVYTGASVNNFFLKVLPKFGAKSIDPGLATAMNVVGVAKARTPWPVGRIQVVKTGSANVVNIWPTSQLFIGAGEDDGATQTDQWPPEFVGNFEWYTSYDATVNSQPLHFWTVTRAGSFTLYVRQKRSGYSGDWKSLVVGSPDGTYTGPSN